MNFNTFNISKRNFIPTLLNSSKRPSLRFSLGTPSSIESLSSHAVVSVILFSLLFSMHVLPVYNLLLFWVERKVFSIVTCSFIVSDLNGHMAITICSIVVIGKLFVILKLILIFWLRASLAIAVLFLEFFMLL